MLLPQVSGALSLYQVETTNHQGSYGSECREVTTGFSATTDTWGFILFYFILRDDLMYHKLVLISHAVEEGLEILTLLSPLEC